MITTMRFEWGLTTSAVVLRYARLSAASLIQQGVARDLEGVKMAVQEDGWTDCLMNPRGGVCMCFPPDVALAVEKSILRLRVLPVMSRCV
jgi:hypothetical protein